MILKKSIKGQHNRSVDGSGEVKSNAETVRYKLGKPVNCSDHLSRSLRGSLWGSLTGSLWGSLWDSLRGSLRDSLWVSLEEDSKR